MSGYSFSFHGADLCALPSGILWWPNQRLLCVSDLHLGRSDRIARLGGTLLPPYENRDTLTRLTAVVQALSPQTVICLGDSFDDVTASSTLPHQSHAQLTSLMAGRLWIWIEGNHDPGPLDLGGTHMTEFKRLGLTFRHIAEPMEEAEISGHYHPKTSVSVRRRSVTRPCFLVDSARIVLPAFGTFTGGLKSTNPALQNLMQQKAIAVLTGQKSLPVPMPAGRQKENS
ncbi:MAG: ligase-associated DNA damage response endonuclease PdeM [Rhodobacteraceae bacterium]|nr:ligase-associated DNA damage response endonuclease PdeM [Paracoccaceae bacterium]